MALAIPGLAGAGDPQLAVTVRPAAPIVLESGGRRDTLISLELQNASDRAVRVAAFRIVYLEGERVVQTVDPATAVFVSAGLVSDPRVEAGAKALWTGLCFAPPTAATDRMRLEFDLAQRRGVRSSRATQAVDVPLRPPVRLAALVLPVDGAWRVTQGHTCDTNHRRSPLGSEFAWDFAAVNETGHAGTKAFGSTHRNDESATFGRPVHAPLAGRVVASVADVDDNDAQSEFPRRSLVEAVRNPRWYFGNYVVIEGDGVFVLLAHLRKGSVVVKVGDVVRERDPIGTTGNSGNTMLPHLHLQVMDRADPADPEVSGLPAVFRDYVEATVRGEGAGRESVVRRVAAGDPPAGAVVFSLAAPTPAGP